MKFIKKKIIILILLLATTLLVMIPNHSEAYNNYHFYCYDDQECQAVLGPGYSNHQQDPYGAGDFFKSVAGVWHSMHKNGSAWLNSKPILASGYRGEAPSYSSTWNGNATIDSVGGLCFGHNRTGAGSGQGNIIKVVIDTYDESSGKINPDIEEQLLGYAAYQSTINRETGSNSEYKQQIRKWIHDNYTKDKYGGFIQSTSASGTKDYATSEAKAYANAAANEALSTLSKEVEGASQTIVYKNGYTFIGPYHLKTEFGNLSGAQIRTREGKSYDTTLCSVDGNTVKSLSSISSYNGNKFYIVVRGNQVESVKNILLTKTMSVVSARVAIAETVRNNGQYISVFYGERQNASKSLTLPGVPFSTIKITKIDTDTQKPIANVGFIVYNETEKKWVKEGVPVSQYVTDKNQATIYKTGANGKLVIKNLSKKGVYKLYEVINPHFGYKEASMDEPSQEIKIDIKAIGTNLEETITNKRIYVKLSGYVWEDIPDSDKETTTNHLYQETDNDKRLNNVTVTLKKANGEEIDNKITNTIQNTKGKTEEGAYLFGDYQRDPKTKRILIEELKGAYIEFTYNGMCYQSIPINIEVENGSKAKDDKPVKDKPVNAKPREKFNENYATIVKGKAQTGNYDLKYDTQDHKSIINYGGKYEYGYEGQKYPISGIDEQYLIKANTLDATTEHLLGQTKYTIKDIYIDEIEEIPNINLGLKEREMPDISLVQDIDRATISLNGYLHTYRYADRFSALNKEIEEYLKQHPDDENIFNVGVNFAQGEDKYTTTIYSSDIVYEEQEENKGKLDVRIFYKMKLTNEASSVNTSVNQLYNYYDSDYEIASIKYVNEKGEVTGQLTKEEYTEQKNYQEKIGDSNYTRVLIHPKQGTKLKANTYQYLEIEYKLKREAILKILNQEKALDSVTEIISYSSYNDNDFTIAYAGIDRDSAPENMIVGDESTYEDDTNHAPTLILKSYATRSIEGTVWQENAIEDLLHKEGYEKQRIGNGQYEKEKEAVIKNVQVELLKLDQDDGQFKSSKLYQTTEGENKTQTGNVISEDKVTKQTDEKGWYEFKGIIPGEYIIRFTYKNSSILYSPEGKELQSLEEVIKEESEGKVENGVEYYKSTLYKTKRDENGTLTTTDYKQKDPNRWYAIDTRGNDKLSDAKDNQDIAEQRTSTKTINNQIATEASRITQISADTHQISMQMDCDDDDLDNISTLGQNLKYEFKNVDFGIIRRPKQDLKIKKEIAYIEVVLANGQVVIKGDPRTEEIPHLKFLPDGNIHIELDNEIIQGATLKIDYEITVNNKGCEIDYNDLDYYYYGTVPEGNKGWKIATITDLIDYPNADLNFNQEGNDGWESITLDQLQEEGRLTEELKELLKQYNIILQTKDFGDMEPGNEQNKHIVFTKLLSNTNDELSYGNDVEISTYEGRKTDFTIPGNYNPADAETKENDNASVDTIITGPTGENQNYLPHILVGITSLIILGSGIILIKKKV